MITFISIALTCGFCEEIDNTLLKMAMENMSSCAGVGSFGNDLLTGHSYQVAANFTRDESVSPKCYVGRIFSR